MLNNTLRAGAVGAEATSGYGSGSATLVDGNGPGTHQSGIIIIILSNIEHQVTYVVTLIGLPASPDSDVGASFSATCATT
jgi:hypothetical protein